jgi:hypothetical protein
VDDASTRTQTRAQESTLQSIDATRTEGQPSALFGATVSGLFVVAAALMMSSLGERVGFGSLVGPGLVAVGLYPIVVAFAARWTGSPMGITAAGAVLPAIAAAVYGIQPPYTWRDVAVPVGIGLSVLVGTWMATSLLEQRWGRRLLWLYVLLVVVGGGFAMTLLLTTSAAPF